MTTAIETRTRASHSPAWDQYLENQSGGVGTETDARLPPQTELLGLRLIE